MVRGHVCGEAARLSSGARRIVDFDSAVVPVGAGCVVSDRAAGVEPGDEDLHFGGVSIC
jgi:hypothetical protein